MSAGLLWNIADLTMGLMAVINMPVIVILSKYALRALKDYKRKKKANDTSSFRASDIGLDMELDDWN